MILMEYEIRNKIVRKTRDDIHEHTEYKICDKVYNRTWHQINTVVNHQLWFGTVDELNGQL